STTFVSARIGSSWGVLSKDFRAPDSISARTSTGSSVCRERITPISAASRETVRMVPSTGFMTALYAISTPRLNASASSRSEEHTSELQSRENLVCRLLLEKKKRKDNPSVKQLAQK